MSDVVRGQLGGSAEYRVETRGGCTLIFGSVPARRMAELSAGAPADTVLAVDLASLTGASLAFGAPKDVDALVARLRTERLATPYDVLPGWSRGANEWFLAGEHGASSATILQRVTGVDHPCTHQHGDTPCEFPLDPADFRRCRLLLDAAPDVAAKFPGVMMSVSPTWAALVAHWDELCGVMDEECADWATGGTTPCPRTYERLHALLFPDGTR